MPYLSFLDAAKKRNQQREQATTATGETLPKIPFDASSQVCL